MTTPAFDQSQAAKIFGILSKEAPKSSSEHRLYFRRGFTPTIPSIEHRIVYLKGNPPHLSEKYTEATIAYLEEELEKRKQGK